MKVLMYSNFSNFFWKEMKSPSSMRNGRFHPSKCRGKVQKMGVLYTHFPKIIKKGQKIGKKRGHSPQSVRLRPQLASNRWSNSQGRPATSGCPPLLHGCPKFLPFKIFLLPLALFFLHMWSILAGWLSNTCPPYPNFS
jgi:hypothetical protein